MQAVILAAGKGTRMGARADGIPKALIIRNGTPLIMSALAALPPAITEIIVIIGHLGEIVEKALGNKYGGVPITYVRQGIQAGTAGALWACEKILHDRFIVLNADDVYDAGEIRALTAQCPSIGIRTVTGQNGIFYAVNLNATTGLFEGFCMPTDADKADGYAVATGAYCLDTRIFGYGPVLLKNGEYGLPQTLALMAKDHPITPVYMPRWRPINTPEELLAA